MFADLPLSLFSCVVLHCMDKLHLLKQFLECWWSQPLSPSLNSDAVRPCTYCFAHWEGSFYAINSLKWNFGVKGSKFFFLMDSRFLFLSFFWNGIFIGLRWVHSVASAPRVFLAKYLGYQVEYCMHFEKVKWRQINFRLCWKNFLFEAVRRVFRSYV